MPAVCKFMKKVRDIGMLINNKSYPPHPVRSAENIPAFAESVHLIPRTSERYRGIITNFFGQELRVGLI